MKPKSTTIRVRSKVDLFTSERYINAADLLKWVKACRRNKRSGPFMRRVITKAAAEWRGVIGVR